MRMKIRILILKTFGYVRLVAAGLLIVAGTIGVWVQEGISGAQELLTPFNVHSFVVRSITLAPGIGALMWAKSYMKNQ